jgi:hypothetical protein
MIIKRLNEDSSWWWEIDGYTVIVDPWFSASQIDLAAWFSEQFHVTPQPKVNELPKPDFIFISHPFTDHCNKETLLQFSDDIPVIALPSVQRKIRKWNHFKQILSLKESPITINYFKPKSLVDLVHGAFLLTEKTGKSLIYSPHGSQFSSLPQADVLITTTVRFYLPFWLGGIVNLGWERALKNAELCGASNILPTHDEAKRGKGLVMKLAKRSERLPSIQDQRIVQLEVDGKSQFGI